jgi:secreted PhoX family phosphatase
MRKGIIAIVGVAAVALAFVGGSALAGGDFGLDRDSLLGARSIQLFGIVKQVTASSTTSVTAQQAQTDPTSLATLAKGLQARAVMTFEDDAAPVIDMMALWPDDANPTHIIACNEDGTADPGLQAIDLSDGSVTTLLAGTLSCDPAHVTPWGTIVFAEETYGGGNAHGRIYELVDPLDGVHDVTLDRSTGAFSDGTTGSGADHFVAREALGRASFEGIGILPNGVVYYGDENRPSSGTAGGAYFKFVPSTRWTTGSDPIDTVGELRDSPLAGGTVYGLRLGKRGTAPGTDYGQGTNTGLGTWISLGDAGNVDLRAAAATNELTGYYRPEDLAFDGAALEVGDVRWCGNNTGNEGTDRSWGETICLTDGTLEQAATNSVSPEVQYLVVGSSDLAMMDNIAYQPGRGNWIIHEDGDIGTTHRNNDLWDCLDDGADADTLSDGCIRIGTLNDLTANAGEGAEWTGGVFDATGTRFFVSVQHNVSGRGVILEVTGWR